MVPRNVSAAHPDSSGDRKHWTILEELSSTIFEFIEGLYNPVRRRSGLGYISPSACKLKTAGNVAEPAA